MRKELAHIMLISLFAHIILNAYVAQEEVQVFYLFNKLTYFVRRKLLDTFPVF